MCVIYQDICFWRNCLHVANVTEFIAAESGASQERFANLLFSSLYCHPGEKLSLKKKALRANAQKNRAKSANRGHSSKPNLPSFSVCNKVLMSL